MCLMDLNGYSMRYFFGWSVSRFIIEWALLDRIGFIFGLCFDFLTVKIVSESSIIVDNGELYCHWIEIKNKQ